MFSLLDAILGRPLQGVLDDLNISPNIRNALLGHAGPADLLSHVLRIVKSYEVGDWRSVEEAAHFIGISPDDLLNCYMDSLSWVDTVFSADERELQADRLSAQIDFRREPETQPVAQ